MKKIAVISAKGGVGKTTISVSLVDYFAKKNKKVTIVDGDVNAPNIAKWFGNESWDKTEDVKVFPLPNKYKNCNDLKLICNGNELPIVLEKRGVVKTKNNFKPIHSHHTFDIISGDIAKGKTGSGKVVEAVLKNPTRNEKDEESIKIIDTAPGTGYPVLTAIQETNYIVIVTEASLLGIADLKKIVSIVQETNKAYGIIINYADTNKKITEEIILTTENHYLGSINNDKHIQQSLEQRTPPQENKDIQKICEEIERRIQ
jgi:MinD superfamily P-loop ATPase